jgi:hypothetical protein
MRGREQTKNNETNKIGFGIWILSFGVPGIVSATQHLKPRTQNLFCLFRYFSFVLYLSSFHPILWQILDDSRTNELGQSKGKMFPGLDHQSEFRIGRVKIRRLLRSN